MGFLSHEFTHLLERELKGETYWPDGGPSLVGVRFLGDSTNYMEVISNIVGETVEHDLISQIPTANRTQVENDRLLQIEEDLATYTDSDALNATRYLVQESWDPNNPGANEVYRENYLHELTIADHRIPADGWDHWLDEMGFSDDAIQHIKDIASKGTAEHVDPATIDTQTGRLSTPTPTPTSTPTSTPTPTQSPTVTPTATSTPSATPTVTPSSTSPPPTQGPQ